MDTIKVIIPTFNSWQTLKRCLKSLECQTVRMKEIIVVDNGSTDGTPDSVVKYFPYVKLIRMVNNTGVTGGRNAGIRTSGEYNYLLIFDHDMIAKNNMVEEMIKVMQLEERIGIVTPKIYYYGERLRIWSAGTSINLWTGQVLFRGGYDVGQFDIIQEVQVAPAAMLIKREVIKDIGFFDDRYFATYEDTDYCFRAKKAGWKIYYAPKSTAYHIIPSGIREESLRLLSRVYWIGRNRILFMKSYANNYQIFLLFLPVYTLYYLNLSLKFGKFKPFLNFVKGTFDGLLGI